MITNGGKEIISKYMLGQVASYASHIAIGCGEQPLKTSESSLTLDEMLQKEYLSYEMGRFPITSRGFVDNSKEFSVHSKSITSGIVSIVTGTVNDIVAGETIYIFNTNSKYSGTHIVTSSNPATNMIQFHVAGIPDDTGDSSGVIRVIRTSVSLTAELPADNRYSITELALWSAANNTLAATFDSHAIFNFTSGWQEHSVAITEPPTISNFGTGGDINQTIVPYKVFYTSTDNTLFSNVLRKNRKEGPRNLNKTLMMRGDTSRITGTAGNWVVTGGIDGAIPIHSHLNNINFNISKNSPSDRLLLAFSLIDRDFTGSATPHKVKILIEFYTNESNLNNGWAKLELSVNGSDFATNRYKIIDLPISQGINESSKKTASILSAYGTGTRMTYITNGTHNFEIGEEVTVSGMSPIGYNVTDAEIIDVNSTSFTIEGGETALVTAGGTAYAYPMTRFITSDDFSSQDIRVARIFTSVMFSDNTSSDSHYIAFDGFRIENITTINPIYKMTGYSIVRNANGYPIVKSAATNGFVEFRFNLGVT